METASRSQSATTRVWGSIGSAEIFAEGTAHTTTKWDVHHAGQIQAGRGGGGRLMELGVYAGEWSALPCGSASHPAERGYLPAKTSACELLSPPCAAEASSEDWLVW
jgi:hypothetical protein